MTLYSVTLTLPETDDIYGLWQYRELRETTLTSVFTALCVK